MSAPAPPDEPIPLKNPALAALLAWMVPGLGHYYQGRRGKAVLYFACIMGLFVIGLILGDFKNVIWRWTSPTQDAENFRFGYVCQFFAGLVALPALIQSTLAHYGVGPILGGYLADPPMDELNAAYNRLSKLYEIGWVYTMVAGLLNIFAIFDAYEGPAHGVEADDAESSKLEVAG